MVNEDKSDNVIRVSGSNTVGFYIRAGTNFLQGVTGKDGEEKKIFDEIVLSALGAAIPTAAECAGILEKNTVGTITKVATSYTELEFGKRPQVMITMKRNPSYVPPPPKEKKGKAHPNDKYADGPPCPEKLNSDKLAKKMAKVRKEGGKRGVEMEGTADMGGTKYLCTKLLEPAGDLDMLVESVKAMNAKSDPTEEERKGGAGNIGKTVISMADQNDLCVVVHVPPALTGEIKATEWMDAIFKKCEISGISPREDSNPCYAQVCIKNDESKNIFCMKLRDYIIQRANEVLTERKLIPEFEESDDDDYVYGDDDF